MFGEKRNSNIESALNETFVPKEALPSNGNFSPRFGNNYKKRVKN